MAGRMRAVMSARPGWLRWSLGALVALVVVLVGVLGVRLNRIAGDLRAARDHLTTAGDLLEEGHILAARDELTEATGLLVHANGDLYSGVDLAVLGWLPGVSQNLGALRESVSLALRISDGGRRTLTAAGPLESADGDLEVPLASGAIPLDVVRDVQVELDGVLGAMPGERPGDSPLLLGPVRRARTEVYDEALGRRQQVAVLSRGLGLLAEMAGATGPRRYLIAVANSAEMRGSGGMILSYGVLEGAGGDFELATFGRIDELALAAPLDPALVPDLATDYQRRWVGFEPLRRWRNANMAGDFTLVAPVLEQMYTAATGKDVDGVIQIDPSGLAAILAGTGPVQVPELGEVTADNVVPFVLNEAYIRFPGVEDRSDVLEEVAEAVFEKLVTGDYESLRPLAEALAGSVEGRHIMMHTTGRAAQARLRYFGATGALPDPLAVDPVHLVVQNLSGNKLDYYLDTALELTGDREPGALGHVRATITLSNTAPVGATSPKYVFGPFDDTQDAGNYRGSVSLYLPAGATLVATEGDALLAAPIVQTEAGRPVVGFTIDVPAGTTRQIVLDLVLAPRPATGYELVLVPSPRVRPTQVAVHLTGGGDIDGTVALDRTWRLAPGAAPTAQTLVAEEETDGHDGP